MLSTRLELLRNYRLDIHITFSHVICVKLQVCKPTYLQVGGLAVGKPNGVYEIQTKLGQIKVKWKWVHLLDIIIFSQT